MSNRKLSMLKVRMNNLQKRDAITNANIIAKIKRQIRKLESQV